MTVDQLIERLTALRDADRSCGSLRVVAVEETFEPPVQEVGVAYSPDGRVVFVQLTTIVDAALMRARGRL